MTAPSPHQGPPLRPAPNRPPVKFRTVDEIATLMRVSKMTVYRLIKAGQLVGAVRIGRSFRVPEKAVEDYLRGAAVELP